MKKTIYFDEFCGYRVAAATESGMLTQFNFERDESVSIKGNIYKGKIVNVLPGMQAAFVDCGLERNCYLCADDAFPNDEKYYGARGETEFPELKEGDYVLVQVIKPPIGKKGAKVTLFPSLVGKSIIYLPKTPFVGVSGKISDVELRDSLAYSVKQLLGKDEGIVLRTAAPYARRDKIEFEFETLKGIYQNILTRAENAKVGEILYSEIGLFNRVLRDILSYDMDELIVSSEEIKAKIEEFYTLFPPARRRPVTVYASPRDMFTEYGLAEQVIKMTQPRVDLENGAYIVIDKCEAMTVIDVNTGCFTGDESLEDTVYYTNVLAAREIARQVKLRNIGGIVVVDFIDMSSEAHNRTVVEELENSLKNFGSKCSIAPMSKFGLVEFTRKREGVNAMSLMCKQCDRCHSGTVKSAKFSLFETRAKLIDGYIEGKRFARIDVSNDTLTLITNYRELVEDLKSRMPDMEIYLSPHRSYSDEQIKLHFDGERSEKAVKLY